MYNQYFVVAHEKHYQIYHGILFFRCNFQSIWAGRHQVLYDFENHKMNAEVHIKHVFYIKRFKSYCLCGKMVSKSALKNPKITRAAIIKAFFIYSACTHLAHFGQNENVCILVFTDKKMCKRHWRMVSITSNTLTTFF